MSWGIVSTVKASLQELARFTAHHISIGCSELQLYLDAPVEGIEALQHPMIQIHTGAPEPEALHKRQLQNARRAYETTKVDWLAHIDSDEFLISSKPITAELDCFPKSCTWAKLPPVEALTDQRNFKIAPQYIDKHKSILEEIYPDFGLHLRSGFLSHFEGKPIARTGLKGARLGIHKLLGTDQIKPRRLEHCWLGHFHAPTWEEFSRQLPRRLTDTSYTSAREGQLSIADLISLIQQESGERGLKEFFMTLRDATPEHLSTLQKHGLLLTKDLNLDEKVKQVFSTYDMASSHAG